MNDSKDMRIDDKFTMADNHQPKTIRGHVKISDKATGKVLLDKDNLVTQRARVWLFEQLFKTDPPHSYTDSDSKIKIDNTRQICLMSVGSGGADINASAFTPYVPLFSDKDLGQKVPFITQDPDKDNDTTAQANPSIVKVLSADQQKKFFMPTTNPDGSTYYYGKRPDGWTDERPYGSSSTWNIDRFSGEVSFSMNFSVAEDECRGSIINELGLWIGTYNKKTNAYDNLELATRICFDSEPLSSLTKALDIEYIMYI